MRPLLAERPLRPAMTRFGQLGMDEAAVEGKLDLLRERLARGPLPRAEARELLISSGLEPGEGKHAHLLALPRRRAARGPRGAPGARAEADVRGSRPRRTARPRRGLRAARAPLPRGLRPGHAARPRLLGQGHGHRRPAGWEDAGRAGRGRDVARPDVRRCPARPSRRSQATRSSACFRSGRTTCWATRTARRRSPLPHDRMPGAGKPAATADGLAFGHWRIERAGGHDRGRGRAVRLAAAARRPPRPRGRGGGHRALPRAPRRSCGSSGLAARASARSGRCPPAAGRRRAARSQVIGVCSRPRTPRRSRSDGQRQLAGHGRRRDAAGADLVDQHQRREDVGGAQQAAEQVVPARRWRPRRRPRPCR